MIFSVAQERWRKQQDKLIAFHADVAVVSYPQRKSGTSFDAFANAGVDPNQPETYSEQEYTGKSSVTITGIAHKDISLAQIESPVFHHVGRFEPASCYFVCRIADATISGQNAFYGAEFVTIGSEKFRFDGVMESGLGKPYVYLVRLQRSNL